MVTMHAAQQYCVYPAEAWVIRSGDGAAGIKQQPCTIGVLEKHGSIIAAELAIVAAERGYRHRLRKRGYGKEEGDGGGEKADFSHQRIHSGPPMILIYFLCFS
jgi:hypothetical protein